MRGIKAMSNIHEQYEKIEIGGKAYMKSPVGSALLNEMSKKGSFINILANRMSMSEAPGRTVSHWR
jgi:hypothetical protein